MIISFGKVKSLNNTKGDKTLPEAEKVLEKTTDVLGGVGEFGVNGLLVSCGFALPAGITLAVNRAMPRPNARVSTSTIVGGATAITLLITSQMTKDVVKRITAHAGYGSSAYFLGSTTIDILRAARVDPFGIISQIERFTMPIEMEPIAQPIRPIRPRIRGMERFA